MGIGRTYFFGFLVLALAAVLPASAFAQAPNTQSPPPATGVSAAEDEFFAGEQHKMLLGGDDLTKKYEGLSLEYGGYERTPILFDPNPKGQRQRVYPQLSRLRQFTREYKDPLTGATTGSETKNTATFTSIDISVDDEILFTKMAMFQPLEVMQDNFADSDALRDSYLNLFGKSRGVAILTLSYLDKTVAAGLATVKSQADAQIANQLLKQISWTSARMANPSRDHVFDDLDNRFQSCMMEFKGPRRVTSAKPAALWTELKTQCTLNCPGLKGYEFCMCCAERHPTMIAKLSTSDTLHCSDELPINVSFSDARIRNASSYWSLAEQTFIGNQSDSTASPSCNGSACSRARGNKPTVGCMVTGQGCDENTQYGVYRFEEMFRWLYGDICLMPGQASTSQAEETKKRGESGYNADGLRMKYIAPMWSVPQAIEVLRNGPTSSPCAPMLYCPITQQELAHGICPAFKKLVEIAEKPGGIEEARRNNQRELEIMWIEASLGSMLTPKDINDVVAMKGPKRERFIDTFCDASAATAFRRLHNRMQSIVEDHLIQSRTTKDVDKNSLRQMVGRVNSYIALGRDDAQSATDTLLIGASIENDRRKEAQRASIVAAGEAAAASSSATTQVLPIFGGGN